MSSLTTIDKRHLEELFEMSGGYVLRFESRNRFADAVRDVTGCQIEDRKYATAGTSMAKRLRVFWALEEDELVGPLINAFVSYAETFNSPDARKVATCRQIARQLAGDIQLGDSVTVDQFLSHEYPDVAFDRLALEGSFIPVMEQRWTEAKACLKAEAHLSAVLLLGSMLEGLLLGAAKAAPKEFNQTASAPKDETGKVLPFWKWNLATLIETAYEAKLLKLDVKKFSHALRDFRNYIHPYEQKASGFTPDQDTARICLQVFRAAVNQLSRY
jgi:hypothetical protein